MFHTVLIWLEGL